jgi:TonB family protein
MTEYHKKKSFLKLPKYPGGSKAFREFIASSLRYPDAALEAGVEGAVIVEYEIHDNGMVDRPRVLKGLGHGCDEEAVRVVGMLRFEQVKNRGVRVTMTTKTTIHFRLPGAVKITYSSAAKKDPPKPASKKENPGSGTTTYNYTVSF